MTGKEQAEGWGLKTSSRGIQVHAETFETAIVGVFAAGNAIRSKGLVVRSVADGKEAAVAIGQFLAGESLAGRSQPFSTKIGRMEPDELVPLTAAANSAPRQEPSGGIAAGVHARRRGPSGRPMSALRLPRTPFVQAAQILRAVPRPAAALQDRAAEVSAGQPTYGSPLRAGQVHRLWPVHPDRRRRPRAVGVDVYRPRLRRPRGPGAKPLARRGPQQSGRRLRGPPVPRPRWRGRRGAWGEGRGTSESRLRLRSNPPIPNP